jgi:hypothetical protein
VPARDGGSPNGYFLTPVGLECGPFSKRKNNKAMEYNGGEVKA